MRPCSNAQHCEHIYDAWGRLVEIENQSSVTVAAFEYNGLGHRIGHQWDKDADTDLDQQWIVYDDKWRVIARFDDPAASLANPRRPRTRDSDSNLR